MRLALVMLGAGDADEQAASVCSATAQMALRAGHQVLVNHGPQPGVHLEALRLHGAQLQQRTPGTRTWTTRRRKPTLAALSAYAPHAVLVLQTAAYDIATPEQREVREALLQERLSFVLLCPTPQCAPTAKTLRHARSIFTAAAICGFASQSACELTRSQLNIPLLQARLLPAACGADLAQLAMQLLQWLQSVAGRRSNSASASAEPAAESTAASSTVHMFWHGPALSRLEQLCMSSFTAHGHEVQLHVYQEPRGVPAGVRLADANRVLAERYLFRHTKSGSIAAFADWFRYVLLYEQGGIWVDTDVVCLKPLRYPQTVIFGRQDEQIINNAVLGLPPRHELAAWMIDCCEFPNRARPYDKRRTRRRKLKRRLFQGNLRGNIAWGENGPLGFTQAARHLGYDHHALPFWHFYPVHFLNWRTVFEGGQQANPNLIAGSNALHLWNEMVRRAPGFHLQRRFDPSSLFEQLCARYLTNDS